MPESTADRYGRWGVAELLHRYPDLRIIPSGDEALKVGGDLPFRVRGPTEGVIEDAYRVEVQIPQGFPAVAPTVVETGGRIPETYHKLTDGSLCLAAPTELRLKLGPESTLSDFVERFVVPYLFGYSHFQKTGVAPYGELEHGKEGLRQYFAVLFGASDRVAGLNFVRLTSLKKRQANKKPCACGSGRRLGRCHHRIVNDLREKLGRKWFEMEYASLETKIYDASSWDEGPSPKARANRRRRLKSRFAQPRRA